MEKRDIIIIIVAIFIVLFMAMYVKPLVTGKPVQLMPDEFSNMLKGGNQSVINNTSIVNSSAKHVTSIPRVNSINPQNITADGNTTKVVIEGKNFTESMDSVTFVGNGENKTFSTSLQNGTLVTDNVTLPEGNWIVKIVDNYTKVTYNTTRSVVVKATITPVPTWDGKPIPLQVTEQPTGTIFKSRPYPEDTVSNATPMKTYSNFSDVKSAKIKSIYIPYGYYDINYSVTFQTHIATPADTEKNVFEFNREYKEPLVVYEVTQTYNNETKQWDYTYTKNESDTEFKPSSDKILTKIPKDEGWTAGSDETPFETETTDFFGQPLVESVGYTKPDITITVKNLDNPSAIPVIIKPNGGIDPLQWNEAKHKDEAEKLMKEKGKQEYFDSDEYKDAWDKKWKTIKDPRPWSERIYGKGNYSLEIDTQSIDSYNIQIKVPEVRNTSYIPKMDENYILEQNAIKKQLSGFFTEFNENLSATYFTNIVDYLATDLTTHDKLEQIYQGYVQTRATGIKVTDVIIDDILVRGNIGKDNSLIQADSATARGNLKVVLNNVEKIIPFDLSFVNEPSGWKFKTLPDIKY
ncbi:IPT/TIG domain-containing protein [Methanospirillum lacunae]|uniref:IPT/TIG domain-containing protein n=1 Tax=Methanospirillum lacunae TaxID=668570 RepID=A0A2V2NFJ4_9EURY|nr:IPT/TIG domain-containing protein [Methanospirillum lacunae]PWR74083.1 hypothetical protein DK846_02690 [Methanospirillum lacunae]